MASIRQALLFTAAERYVVISLNFLATAIIARLLTPQEFGFSVIGAATIAFAECFRDFGASGFIVQQPALSRSGARTAFTVMLILSLVVALVIWCVAEPLADFYEMDGLRLYMEVTAIGFLAGPFSGPQMALLRRDMNFGSIAIINVASASTTAAVTVVLALLGASYMSFAWGVGAGAFTAAVLAVAMRCDFWLFRPTLREWRSVLSFGGYSSAAGMLAKAYDVLPPLLLGRVLDFTAVGFYSRAVIVCQIPDKCLLTGLTPIALPAMAAEVRGGRSLRPVYLHGISYITVVQWPSLILLAILAHPAVSLLLGSQWTAIVPLVQIMALGLLMSFTSVLAYPLLVAAGAVRDAMFGAMLVLMLGGTVIVMSSFWGLTAVALGSVAAVAVQSCASLYFVGRHIELRAREILAALWRSAAIAMLASMPPVIIVALNGFDLNISIPMAAVAIAGAGIAWLIGLFWTGHPLLTEVMSLAYVVRRILLRGSFMRRPGLRVAKSRGGA